MDTLRSQRNYDGGFIAEQIPDLQITEAQPCNENRDVQETSWNDQEALSMIRTLFC